MLSRLHGELSASRSPLIRIFFTTDIHGSEQCFRKFLNAGGFYQADVLIMGGDVTGKAMIPLVERPGGTFTCHFVGRERTLAADEVAEMERLIRASGFYPFRSTVDEVDALAADPQARERKFSALVTDSLERWMALAEERLAHTGIRCFVSPGNDDEENVDAVLAASSFVENPEGEVIELADGRVTREMISCGWSGPTPFETPRECSEDELAARIEAMASRLRSPETAIFNLHNPPFNSRLDLAPALDENLQVQSEGGQTQMVPVGSTAVRTAIERYRPRLSIHGHIHESRGEVRIGPTSCINPGSEYGEGVLRGAIIDFNKDKLKSIQLMSG
jgi:Icc-related predicted phosphoesterase